MSVQFVPNMHIHIMITVLLSPFAHPFDKITDDIHEFSLQLKESFLAEFDNDDAITSEDNALVRNDMGHFWSRFGSGTTTNNYRCNCCQHISERNANSWKLYCLFPKTSHQYL
jgi:hypothetical protein